MPEKRYIPAPRTAHDLRSPIELAAKKGPQPKVEDAPVRERAANFNQAAKNFLRFLQSKLGKPELRKSPDIHALVLNLDLDESDVVKFLGQFTQIKSTTGGDGVLRFLITDTDKLIEELYDLFPNIKPKEKIPLTEAELNQISEKILKMVANFSEPQNASVIHGYLTGWRNKGLTMPILNKLLTRLAAEGKIKTSTKQHVNREDTIMYQKI